MPKPVSGTWFEFQHFFDVEGKYWNDTCARFTAADWCNKIAEMAGAGISNLVLMNVACNFRAFYQTPIFPRHELGCPDPVGTVLDAAGEAGISVFVGLGFFTPVNTPVTRLNESAETRRRLAALNELAARYGSRPAFAGWYWPHEASIYGHFSDGFIQYVNTCSAEARRLMPAARILIAPYGTRTVIGDDLFVSQLDRLDVDIVAYQDEVGVEKTSPEELPRIWERLRRAHDRVPARRLFADVEIFRFEGRVYNSALVPAPFERVRAQIEAASPYVEAIFAYQYQGMMNSPGSLAFAGHPNSTALYADYDAWRRTLSATAP